MKRTAGTLLLGASLLVAACGSEDVEAQTDTDEGGQADVQADEPSGDSVETPQSSGARSAFGAVGYAFPGTVL